MKASDINHAFTIITELCGAISGKPVMVPYCFQPKTMIILEQIKTNLQYALNLLESKNNAEDDIIIGGPNG